MPEVHGCDESLHEILKHDVRPGKGLVRESARRKLGPGKGFVSSRAGPPNFEQHSYSSIEECALWQFPPPQKKKGKTKQLSMTISPLRKPLNQQQTHMSKQKHMLSTPNERNNAELIDTRNAPGAEFKGGWLSQAQAGYAWVCVCVLFNKIASHLLYMEPDRSPFKRNIVQTRTPRQKRGKSGSKWLKRRFDSALWGKETKEIAGASKLLIDLCQEP